MLRRIQTNFNSAYVTPTAISKKVQQFTTQKSAPVQDRAEQARRDHDRRCNRDRRQQRQAILMDLRSPYTRRKIGRRSEENTKSATGIDIYA